MGPFLIVVCIGLLFGQITPRLASPLLILSGLAIMLGLTLFAQRIRRGQPVPTV